MKRLIAALALTTALAMPGTASAGGWYWGEGAAERYLETHYTDVISADCNGYGRRWHRLYHHFDCALDLDDGTSTEVDLTPKGRYRAHVTFV